MGVLICIDSKCVADCAEPTDAWDWLMSEHGLPEDLFQKADSDFGLVKPTWSDLPVKFFWKGHKYMVSKVDNLRKQHESEQPVLERSPGTRKEMGKFFPFAGNEGNDE